MIARACGAAALLFLLPGWAEAAPTKPPRWLGADSLAARALVRQLADPAFEGRGIGTAGIDRAAEAIAERFKRAGLRPGGEGGTWYQPVEVTTGVQVRQPTFVEVKDARWEAGASMQPVGFSTNGTVKRRVIFVGHGVTAPGFEWDDYAGVDVHDALVLVIAQEPGEMEPTSRFDGTFNTAHAELRTKAINAREHGALGMLVVHGPKWHSGEPLRAPARDGSGYMTSGLLAASISEEVADALMRGAGTTLAEAQEMIESQKRPHSLVLPDSATLTVALERTRATTNNVIGLLPGSDTTRTLVLGAHYDHLGFGGSSSLSPDSHEPHVGADDNASGTTALVLAAERMAARKGKPRAATIAFAAFTAEEIGLVGSSRFADDPPRPFATIEAMINMDMVGRLREDKLSVMGLGTSPAWRGMLEGSNRALASGGFTLRTSDDGYGPSDHSSFYKKNLPVLMLFTGAHEDYHRPTDTWEKVHAAGVARISRLAEALLDSLAARPRIAFTKAKADTASMGRIAGGGGYGSYLGTIPDYMQTEGGVLLSGVRAGSPADQGGLRGGDTLVGFDGIRVDNIYDYTFALRSRKPGQSVRVNIKRGGESLELAVTLGRRP